MWRLFFGKPEGNVSLGRPRYRGEHDIKMDYQEIRCVGVDWMYLNQDRNKQPAVVNTAMNFPFP